MNKSPLNDRDIVIRNVSIGYMLHVGAALREVEKNHADLKVGINNGVTLLGASRSMPTFYVYLTKTTVVVVGK